MCASLSEHPASRRLSRVDRTLRILLLAHLALAGVAWRLWFARSDFPRIPLLPGLTNVPTGLVQVLAAVQLAAMGRILIRWRGSVARSDLILPLLTGGLLIVLNQHCLQAWHWLLLLALTCRLLLCEQGTLTVLRRLLPTVYLFAAVSRLGPAIDTGMSPRIVTALLELLQLPVAAANPSLISWLALLATLFELAVGLLLWFPRTRHLGWPAAVVMHSILLLVLSPLGMDQHTGVMMWNFWLLLLNLSLYVRAADGEEVHNSRTGLATGLLIIWPALALVGITDNWTGWQLYSPRPEVLQWQVHVDAGPQLPSSLQPHVSPPQTLQDWCDVRLDRWSLQETGTPIYPQGRFQIAVAQAVSMQVAESRLVRARMWRPKTWVWWKRERVDFADGDVLAAEAERYWLNTQAAPSRENVVPR